MTARVPKGYKQTEVGVIPEEWEVKPLGQVAQIISGGTPSTLNPEYWDGGIMWCTPSDITATSGKYLEATERTISQKGLQSSSASLLPPGSLLLCTRATIGDVKIATQPTATNQGFKSLVIDAEQADNEFVYYQLLTFKDELIQRGVGSTFLEVSRKDVASLFIPLPPLPEQQAIAGALGDVDSLLAALDRLIAKKRAVRAAAMRDLLTGRVRLPGFEGEWEFHKLGEFGFVYSGLSGKRKADFGQGEKKYIPFLNVIYNTVINPSYLERVSILPGERQNRVQKDDVFFNSSSETPEEVGMCAVLLENINDIYLNSFCFGFRVADNDNLNSLFIAYFFRSPTGRQKLYPLAQGVTRYNLSKTNLLSVDFLIPSLPEQTAIAAVLSDLDAELAALERERAKWQSIKQGMMDDLLTGRVRLV